MMEITIFSNLNNRCEKQRREINRDEDRERENIINTLNELMTLHLFINR